MEELAWELIFVPRNITVLCFGCRDAVMQLLELPILNNLVDLKGFENSFSDIRANFSLLLPFPKVKLCTLIFFFPNFYYPMYLICSSVPPYTVQNQKDNRWLLLETYCMASHKILCLFLILVWLLILESHVNPLFPSKHITRPLNIWGMLCYL